MIHELLPLTRPLFTIDCETTGTDVNKDRIVGLGFERWEATGKTMEWKSLMYPGISIPPETTAVHGITDAMVRVCKECGQLEAEHLMNFLGHEFILITFKVLAPSLARGLNNCDFAGKNVRFDLRIIAAEFKREGIPWDYSGARIIDAERLEQLGVPRTLSDLYEKYVQVRCVECEGSGGTPAQHCAPCYGHGWIPATLEGAHDALTDVKASTLIITRQLEVHRKLPRDLDALHELQWPGWIDGDGKFRFVNRVPCFGMWGKYAGKPMKAADKGYWDFILSNDFGVDVKKLAAAAKLGKFPEMK